MKTLLRVSLILIAGLILFSNNSVSGQSLKKTFKYLDNVDISKANLEIQKFSEDNLKTNENLVLYGFATCIIVCSEKYHNYDPYRAMEVFEITSNIQADRTYVNEFLTKYSLSVAKINETVCSSILNQAKQINTEASYKKALQIGNKCGFSNEVDTLWVNAAYNEAKSKNTYEAYVHFYSSHGTSRYTNEVFKKFNEFEFQRAKRINSLEALNDYINGRSDEDNPYLEEAIQLRDSIAYSNLSRSYYEYQGFIEKYPNSEYAERILIDLPELLYDEAVKNNNAGLMEVFIIGYPIDSRVNELNSKLEIIYFENLKTSNSLEDIEKFKKRFPDSSLSADIEVLMDKLMSKSDLKKYGLKGRVESIDTKVLKKPHFDEGETQFFEKYNELGYISSLSRSFNNEKVVDLFELENLRIIEESRLLDVSRKQGCIDYSRFFKIDEKSWGIPSINFEYDNKGRLIKINGGRDQYSTFSPSMQYTYEYDENGNVITEDLLNIDRLGDTYLHNLEYKTKYKWSDGFLIYKHIFSNNGDRYKYYDFTYEKNKLIVNITNYRGKRIERVEIEYNDFYLIQRKIHYHYSDINVDEKLLESELLECSYEQYSHGDLYEYKIRKADIFGRNSDYKVIIERDSEGMITSSYLWGDKPTKDFEYKYDSHGNWVEKIEYSIVRNDIEIRTKEKVIKREIEYY